MASECLVDLGEAVRPNGCRGKEAGGMPSKANSTSSSNSRKAGKCQYPLRHQNAGSCRGARPNCSPEAFSPTCFVRDSRRCSLHASSMCSWIQRHTMGYVRHDASACATGCLCATHVSIAIRFNFHVRAVHNQVALCVRAGHVPKEIQQRLLSHMKSHRGRPNCSCMFPLSHAVRVQQTWPGEVLH